MTGEDFCGAWEKEEKFIVTYLEMSERTWLFSVALLEGVEAQRTE